MFFEKAARPTKTLSGPIPTNLDSLLGGFEAAKYTGGGGRNSRAMVEAEVWQPILDELREYDLDFANPGHKRFEYAFMPKIRPSNPFGLPGSVQADQLLQEIYSAVEINKFRLPEDIYNAAQPEAIKQAELEIVEGYEQDLADMAQKNPSLMAGISRFGGAIGSSVYDPYVIAPMGGPIKSLWKTMLQNAVGGGLYGAASEIDVANWFNSLNKDYTFDQFVFNVTSQAAFGAALPGVMYGIGKGVKLTSEIAGLTNAQAREGWEAIRRSRPEAIPEEDNALANVLEVYDDVEQSNPLSGADNFDDALAKTEHELRTLQAQEAINTDQKLTMPEEPVSLVDPDVLTADLPNLDGRKFRFEVDQLEVDAKVFQFKSGGDELGVTERLLDIDEWNYDIANDIMVFETREGRLIIADGHQRLALAKRLMAKDPSLDIKLYGVVKREIDGYEPKTVMLDAALKNIAEATKAERANVIMDAAKVLKIAPERLEGIPPRSALYKVIQNLLKLDDAAFDLVDQGIIKEKYGALIGDIIADKDLHVSAVKVLKQTDPKTMDEAESIVRQVEASPKEVTEQVDLFGEELITESLFIERAKILHQALVRIRKDKSTFATINKNASKLEIEGNKIERQANQKRVQNDENAIAYLNAVANRKGPLSDALSAEAKTAKETGNYREAVDRFIGHIRRSVEQGDFDRAARSNVTSSSQPPKEISTSKSEPQQAIDEFDEPGSEAARAETANLKDDIFPQTETEGVNLLANLKFLLGTNPTREQINNHPAVLDAIKEINSRPETINESNFGTPEWHQNRVYNIEGEEVVGTEAALVKFEEQAEALAYKELGLAPGTIARNKELTIILGPPAAGKSTIANEVAVANRSAILDSDEIKKTLPEFEDGKGTGAVHEESSRLAKAVQSEMIDRGTNITLPKVGENVSSIRNVVSLYKEKGYKVRLLLMDVTPENAINRMLGRFVNTGRYIDLKYLDFVGTKPGETFRILRKEGAADGYAKIDNNGEFDAPKTVSEISGNNPLRGSRFDIQEGRRAEPGGFRRPQSDTEKITSKEEVEQEVSYNPEEEIYVDLDGQGNLTLMKVKDVLDPIEKEDDFIKQLEICKL